MIPENQEVKIINASPLIGDNASSCFEPNVEHIQKMVKLYKPKVICACGKMAQKGCRFAELSFISAPHPACRTFSKKQAQEVKREINRKLTQETARLG
jgi:hypothetical protein